jgi:hypothetical protein
LQAETRRSFTFNNPKERDMTSEIVAAGKAAWTRLKNGSKSWGDWVQIGHALLEGRAIAMRDAGVSSPIGGGYTTAFMARDADAVAAGAHEPSRCRAEELSASDQYQAAPQRSPDRDHLSSRGLAAMRGSRERPGIEPAPPVCGVPVLGQWGFLHFRRG